MDFLAECVIVGIKAAIGLGIVGSAVVAMALLLCDGR